MSEDAPITRRLWHRFVLGSGPLKRSSDRIQVLSRILLVLALLTAVPVSLAVATATGSSARTVADAQAAGRYQVQATLTADAVARPGNDVEQTVLRTGVEATWTDATGTIRQGVVSAPVGARAGSSVAVWIDDGGAVTKAPMGDSQVLAHAVLAGLYTFVVISVGSSLGHFGVGRMLERSRMRRWAEGWAAVEPVWSRKVP